MSPSALENRVVLVVIPWFPYAPSIGRRQSARFRNGRHFNRVCRRWPRPEQPRRADRPIGSADLLLVEPERGIEPRTYALRVCDRPSPVSVA
jgi:hypothetical protein